MKETGTLGSIIHGVTQQPLDRRNQGTCESMVNMLNDVTTGPRRRPGSELKLVVDGVTGWNQHMFTQLSVDCVMFISPTTGDVRVFTLHDGIEVPVSFANDVDNHARTYLTSIGESAITSNSERGYILNRNATPAMLPDVVTSRRGIYVNLISTNFGKNIEITAYNTAGEVIKDPLYTGILSDFVYVHTGVDPSDYTELDTSTVMQEMITGDTGETFRGSLPMSLLWGTTLTYERANDTIFISDGTEELGWVVVSDGNNGNDLKVCADTISSTDELPRYAYSDTVIQIAGNERDTTENANYYLRFDPDHSVPSANESFGAEGIWVETVGSNDFAVDNEDITYKIDPSTMPCVFRYEDGTFYIEPENWADRMAGDNDSNRIPRILQSKKINDILIYQSRLFFLGDNYLCGSRIEDFNNVWRDSATQVVGDDRIDIETSFLSADKFNYLAQMDQNLWLFGDTHQYILPSSSGISAESAFLAPAGRYSAYDVRPVTLENDLAYAQFNGAYSKINLLRTVSSSFKANSVEVSEHIPSFIQGSVTDMAVSTQHNVLAVLASGSIYLYEWQYNGADLAQSAWSEMEHAGTVQYIDFLNDVLILTIDEGTQRILYTINFGSSISDVTGTELYMDRIVPYTTGDIPVTIPLADLPIDFDLTKTLVIQPSSAHHAGMITKFTYDNDNMYLSDFMANTEVAIGEQYTSSLRPSMPVLRDDNNFKKDYSSFTINNLLVRYVNTGPFTMEPISPWSTYDPVKVAGRRVGGLFNLLGVVTLSTDMERVPMRIDANFGGLNIYTDSHYPMNISSIDYQGQSNTTGKRRRN